MKSKISIPFLTKLIQILFLIVLQNFVLDGAMGIFAVALILYYAADTFFLSGLSLGVSKMVSAHKKGTGGNANHLLKSALLYVLAASAIVALLHFLLLPRLSAALFGTSYVVPVFWVFSGIFWVTGITEVLCGYHTGNQNAYAVNLTYFVKTIMTISGSVFIIRGAASYGTKVAALIKEPFAKDAYMALGIAGTYLFSCVAALIVLCILTLKDRNRFTKESVRTMERRHAAGNLISFQIQSMLDRLFFVLAIVGAVLLYLHAVTKTEIVIEDAYTNLGILMTKVLLPFLLVLLLFLEYLYKERFKLHVDFVKEEHRLMTMRVQYMIKNSVFLLLPSTLFFIFMAEPIVKVFYAGQTVLSAGYLQKGGALLLLLGICFALHAILKAFDKTIVTWGIQGIGFVFQMIFLLSGYAGASADSMLLIYSFYFNFGIQIAALFVLLLKIVRPDFRDILQKLGKCAAAGMVMMILFIILEKFITMNFFLLLLSLFFGYLLYDLTLIALHGISKKDEASIRRTLSYYPVHFLKSRLRM